MAEPITKAWSSERLAVRLTLLFLAMATVLIGLTGVYWIQVLEPRLHADAQVNAGVLAQSHALTLADAVSEADTVRGRQRLLETMDEVLLLTDPNTDTPFILGLRLNVDYDVVRATPGTLDIQRGRTNCDACFVTRIPLYAENTRELLGVATFYSSNAFFERLKEDVRTKLFIGSGILLFALLLVWAAVAGLVRQIRTSERAAAAATRAKSEFLANMSHEIRTPMTAILGTVRLLRDTRLDEQQRDYLGTVDSSGEALLSILDDILDISKVEAGKLTLEMTNFDIETLIHGIVRLMDGRAREKGLALSYRIDEAVPACLHGDPARIRQVLLNLVGNAIKFTDVGQINIAVRPVDVPRQGRADLEFTVTDTGPGIPAEEQAQLFEQFTQADASTARKYGGSGLGLAICKRLTEAMGGSIFVDSTPKEGSTFGIKLPFTIVQQETCPEAGEPTIPETITPLRVLLADDNDINRRVTKSLLSRDGHSVTEATNGREVMEAIQDQDFDVVLMDLHMPEVDGLEAAERIRTLPELAKARVPILALTANIMRQERERCARAGMDGFVVKPFHPDTLYREIEKLRAKGD